MRGGGGVVRSSTAIVPCSLSASPHARQLAMAAAAVDLGGNIVARL